MTVRGRGSTKKCERFLDVSLWRRNRAGKALEYVLALSHPTVNAARPNGNGLFRGVTRRKEPEIENDMTHKINRLSGQFAR